MLNSAHHREIAISRMTNGCVCVHCIYFVLLHAQGPVNVTALVAHLLFLAANGGMQNATALPDTFGTAAFVSVAEVGEFSGSGSCSKFRV